MSCISVIIPAFNRAHLIGETLRSLLSQTLAAEEIIVVDDGSTDNTAEVAASFGSPVRVIRQANSGPGAARNAGFRASRGEFIHFFDSDDLAAPNKHAIQAKALKQGDADIAIGPWIQGRFVHQSFQADNHVLQQRGLPRERNLIKALLANWSVVPHSAMFRRHMVEAAGRFDEELFVGEDQLMFLNCLLTGARVVHTPDTIEFYRLGEPDKITENAQWNERRAREWASFLLRARERCLTKGLEPLNWLGYRRRVWEAEQNLRRFHCKDQKLLHELTGLRGAPIWNLLFRCLLQLERWKGGLQCRLTGGRSHSSFRIGPMTAHQIASLHHLGYACEMPGGLLMKPQQIPNRPSCAG